MHYVRNYNLLAFEKDMHNIILQLLLKEEYVYVYIISYIPIIDYDLT